MNIILALLTLLVFSILINLLGKGISKLKLNIKEINIKRVNSNNTAESKIKLSKKEERIVKAIEQIEIKKQPKIINYDMEKDFMFLNNVIINKCESFKKLDMSDFFIDGNSFLNGKEFEDITDKVTMDIIETLSENYKAKLYYYIDKNNFNSYIYEKVYCRFLDDINSVHAKRMF